MIIRRHPALATLTIALVASIAGFAAPAQARANDTDGLRSGMVFTSTNAQSGNELLVYAQNPDGSLSSYTRAFTGGLGSDAGLGSQGAVTLSGDGHYVFVVNAQSNSLSTFTLDGKTLRLGSVVASGGLHPISITEYDGIVYVLNDGGDGNIAGFRNVGGALVAIAGSVQGLSVAGGAGPAEVGFSSTGDALVVTEKNTNRLTSYRVLASGGASAPVVTASPGATPFGFAFNRRNDLLVTEAQGGAAGASSVSSYRFRPLLPARPFVASASVADTQTSACWIAITPDGRHAYAANTGASSVSSYSVGFDGRITLVDAVAGQTGSGSSPADAAISADGGHLFVRSGGTLAISPFSIDADGSLVAAPVAAGLPTSAVGLAAN